MMKEISQTMWVCLVGGALAGAAMFAGCQEKVVRPGVTTIDGAVIRDTSHSPELVAQASETAFADLGFAVAENTKVSETARRITAHSPAGVQYIVNAKRLTPRLTRISLLIKPGQNESASRIVLEKITSHLP